MAAERDPEHRGPNRAQRRLAEGKGPGRAKHTVRVLNSDGTVGLVRLTSPRPWAVKRARRAAAKRARAARKANR